MMNPAIHERLLKAQDKYRRTVEKTRGSVDKKRFPQSYEPALIHPHNSSIVKIREEGIIDVFVGTDNGIRIDPKNKSINFFSDAFRQRSMNEDKHIFRDAKHLIDNNWSIQVKGNTLIDVGNDFEVKSERIIFQGEEVHFPSLMEEVKSLREAVEESR